MGKSIEKDEDLQARRNSSLRITLSCVMLLMGALAVVLTEGGEGRFNILFQKVGLALIVAGVVSVFTEVVLERYKSDPAARVKKALEEIHQTGMKMLCFPRKGYWRYHTWVLINDPQELFFAVRSVLHRIQEDFKNRRLPNVEDILIRKVEEGSKIKVLFCNPTWELIPQLAKSEGQPELTLFTDLATSLGIVSRLWEKLKSKSFPGEIEIRLYNELIQYAYHFTKSAPMSGGEVLIGFYFAQKLGCKSPLFEVEDEAIRSEFNDHFVTVFARATKLMEYPAFGNGKNFNQKLFMKSKDYLMEQLGAEEIKKLIG